MIEKRAGKWVVLSKDGRVLGEHDTEAEAQRQLRAVEASKHTRADVLRLDATAARRLDNGFLRVPARITRTGIMEYHRGGRVVRELRRPEQVLREDSYRTLAGVPVTIGHAVPVVTARDTREHAVGYVEADVRPSDGRYLDATVMVWRADAADQVERRELTELSAGYAMGEGPGGVWQGQAYDLEQTDIRYNHVALLPAGHARGGSELALRLDNHDLISFLREKLGALGLSDAQLAAALDLPDAHSVRFFLDGDMGMPSEAILTRAATMVQLPVAQLLTMAGTPPAPSPPARVSGMKRQITINGTAFEVEVPDAVAPTFDAALAADTAATAQARTDAADIVARLADTETRLGQVTAERDGLQSRVDASELSQVRERATAAFPAAQGDTARDLHLSVLAHLGHQVREDASDAEIAGMFAVAVTKKPEPGPRGVQLETPGTRSDASEPPTAGDARARMIERGRNAWKRPNA